MKGQPCTAPWRRCCQLRNENIVLVRGRGNLCIQWFQGSVVVSFFFLDFIPHPPTITVRGLWSPSTQPPLHSARVPYEAVGVLGWKGRLCTCKHDASCLPHSSQQCAVAACAQQWKAHPSSNLRHEQRCQPLALPEQLCTTCPIRIGSQPPTPTSLRPCVDVCLSPAPPQLYHIDVLRL